MSKRTVEVTFTVEVEMDDSKFDETFMREYRETFQPLESLDDHAENIARLEVIGLLDPSFTEGYGPLKDMGIKAKIIDEMQEVSHV